MNKVFSPLNASFDDNNSITIAYNENDIDTMAMFKETETIAINNEPNTYEHKQGRLEFAFEKVIQNDDNSEDKLISVDFLSKIYDNKEKFNSLVTYVILKDDDVFYWKFLRSVSFLSFDLKSELFENIYRKCLLSSNFNLIERCILVLEKINDKSFSKRFVDITLKNRFLNERLRNITNG